VPAAFIAVFIYVFLVTFGDEDFTSLAFLLLRDVFLPFIVILNEKITLNF